MKYIDLGLPSGTKWGEYDLLGFPPAEDGEFFDVGEEFSWPLDKYIPIECFIDYYNSGSENEIPEYVDKKSEIDEIDDEARKHLGKYWRTPSENQVKELFQYCKWKYMSISPCLFPQGPTGTIKVTGPNGNYIYFPIVEGKELYWTRNADQISEFYAICFSVGKVKNEGYYSDLGELIKKISIVEFKDIYNAYRSEMFFIRPVYIENVTEPTKLKWKSKNVFFENDIPDWTREELDDEYRNAFDNDPANESNIN